MATITTDDYLDGGTSRTAGESWTCNGGKLTIRTDTRWHANAPASMTGSLGSQTVSATLGGGILIDGRNVRWMPFDTGTSTVPDIGTTITQGGVSGYLLGVWDTLTSAPTAVGAAMPADGFIKFREVTGGPFTTGALTGIGANATGPDVTGWIEVVMDQAATITASRKGTGHVTRGDWFYLDNTNGSVGQVLQVPTNGGGANTYCPGVWIETAPSSNEYEFWPALNGSSNGWAVAHVSAPTGNTDRRQSFVKVLGSGQMQIGEANSSASLAYTITSSSATYTWANDIVTVSLTAHGYSVGEVVYMDFTSGGATADGVFTVEQVTGANSFTVALAGSGTSGNVTLRGRAVVTYTSHPYSIGMRFYLNATSGDLADGVYEVVSTATNTLTFNAAPSTGSGTGGNLTLDQTIGHVPASGCKVRIPNVFLRQCTTGARATNATPATTITDRPDFTVTGAGVVDHEFTYGDWYYLTLQSYQTRLKNVATFDALNVQECATALDWDNVGVGASAALDLPVLTLASNLAGGTIANSKFFRCNTPGTNDHAVSVSLCNGPTFDACHAGITQYTRSSGYGWNISQSSNVNLTDCRSINGGTISFVTATDCTVTNLDWVDRFHGFTNSASATYTITISSKSNNITIDGVTEGYAGTFQRQHAYAGLLNVTSSSNVKFRNAGTRSAPLAYAVKTFDRGYIYVSGGNNSNISVQRCYVGSVRTGLVSDANTDKNVLYESLSAPHLSTWMPYTLTVAALNARVKGCKAPLLVTAANASVYGTHWWDTFTSWFRQLSTYTWSGNVVTVSFTAHGYVVGDKVYLDFTSGGATADGVYTVRSSSANSFTVDLSGSGTSGNCISWRHMTATPSDLFTTEGRLHLPMNEDTAETTDYITLAGTAQFTSAPGLSLPAADDEAVIESQHTILGHTSFPNIPAILTGTPVSQASTYTWTGNVVTVTFTAHGLIAGDTVFLDASSGTLPDGLYTIASVSSANAYTISLAGSGTSGNCTAFRLIRAEYKINTGSGYNASWRNLNLYKVGCAVSSGSATVTMVSTDGIAEGDYVYAPGIKADTTVDSVDSATQITLSQTADVTNSNRQLIFNQLPNESISASTGFTIKVRITADTPGKTMVITYLTIPTTTTAASQDNLYPLDVVPASLALTGLKANTEVRVYRTSDDALLDGVENSGTSFIYNYTWTGTNTTVYVVLHALGYLPIRYEGLTLGSAGLSIPVQQVIDRQYSNP